MVALYLVLFGLMLAANAFFVAAEFAIVRVRESRVEALIEEGRPRARLLQSIQHRMDEYLSVVQLGVTVSTLGMGLVMDEGMALPLYRLAFGAEGHLGLVVCTAAAFAISTYLSIVLSELVPKALALRNAERLALGAAPVLIFLHGLLRWPIKALNQSAQAVLRLLGVHRHAGEGEHSEEELRIILGSSQERGLMSFRRLLMFENVFDLDDIAVREAMRPRREVQIVHLPAGEEEVRALLRLHRFSRYPVVDPGAAPEALPLGILHVKDLLLASEPVTDIRPLLRPFLTLKHDATLEAAFGDFQRSRNHLAMVTDAQGAWCGVLSFEDVIEDIAGQIHDEFERESPLRLDEMLASDQVALDVEAPTIAATISAAGSRLKWKDRLPEGWTTARLTRELQNREAALSTYVGHGVAIPHVRIEGLTRPLIGLVRSVRGLPVPGRSSEARLLFVVLTPAAVARLQLRILARLAHLLESDYVIERLLAAETPAEALEVISAADHTVGG